MSLMKSLIKDILTRKAARELGLNEVDNSADQYDPSPSFWDSAEERADASLSFDKADWEDSTNDDGNIYPEEPYEEGKSRVSRLFIDDWAFVDDEADKAEYKRRMKAKIADKLNEFQGKSIQERKEEILEDFLNEARFKIVTRVRKGKVQRRKKVATQAGYTFRAGKLIRMKAAERMRRKIQQRKAAKKRVAKQSQRRRNMAKSLRIRNRVVPGSRK